MSNPITSRSNTLDQWRINLNTIGNNVGDPAGLYSTDGSDSFILPNANILIQAINDLNTRKVKRSGDTIANLAITTSLTIGTTLSVAGITTITNNTPSTSPSTGALVITGGLGIGGALYLGGAASIAGGVTIGGNVAISGTVLTVNGVAVVTTASVNNYSPSLTGVGASGTWGISITGNASSATTASSVTNGAYINIANTFTQNQTISGAGSVLLSTTGDITASRTANTGALYLGSNQTHFLTFDGTNFGFSGTSQLLINGNTTHHNGNFLITTSFTPVWNAWALNNTGLPMHISFSFHVAIANAWNYVYGYISSTPSGGYIVDAAATYYAYPSWWTTNSIHFIVPAGKYYYISTPVVPIYTVGYY